MSTVSFAQRGGQYQHHQHRHGNSQRFEITLDRLANETSDYWRKDIIESYTANNTFNTQQFKRMLRYVNSDYYRYQLARFAMKHVSNPTQFDLVVPMLNSRYYQRELTHYIYNHPRYNCHYRAPKPNHHHRHQPTHTPNQRRGCR
ncbi:MAG: DUF4476 domain-containing protein [Bacteroidetes bacterium]|nr:DUF4476 domain-containing protein [Bacteroidota bacterium]